jgi:hypothetical protein
MEREAHTHTHTQIEREAHTHTHTDRERGTHTYTCTHSLTRLPACVSWRVGGVRWAIAEGAREKGGQVHDRDRQSERRLLKAEGEVPRGGGSVGRRHPHRPRHATRAALCHARCVRVCRRETERVYVCVYERQRERSRMRSRIFSHRDERERETETAAMPRMLAHKPTCTLLHFPFV